MGDEYVDDDDAAAYRRLDHRRHHKSVAGLDDKGREDFQYALLLGVAYGATIGGMATLVGTAPNAMLAAFMLENYGTEIDFANWMLVGLPLSADDAAARLAVFDASGYSK